jgi:hypothetical protein
VTIFLRRLSTLSALLARPSGRPALAACSTLALCAALLACAAPAGAVVTTVESTTVGLQPRTEVLHDSVLSSAHTLANNSGNVILNGTSVYAIYWDPEDAFFDIHHEWLVSIDNFMQNLGADSGDLGTIFAALGQYRDRGNSQANYKTVFKGSYTDSTSYPTAGCTDPEPLEVGAITCLTDAQLRAQLQSFIAEHSLPKGMGTIYYLVTPPGVTLCLDAASTHCSDYSLSEAEEHEREFNLDFKPGPYETTEPKEYKSASYKNSFCSYHAAINPDAAAEGDGNTILYAAIPWTAAGTFGDLAELPSNPVYREGETCQDGGWYPTEVTTKREEPKEFTAEEKATYEKDDPEAKAAVEKRWYSELPHQEEPNQSGKNELGEYDAGLPDLIVNQIAEEQANTVTDPLLNGWQTSEGAEVTDVCRDTFGNTAGGHGIGGSVTPVELTEAGTLSNQAIYGQSYYINNVYSLSEHHCVGGVGLSPSFTAPNPVSTNEIVGFDGMESSVSLLNGEVFGSSGSPSATYATFNWNFGDGTETSGFAPNSAPCEAPWLSPCAGSVFHTYKYGGVYHVKLTVTDIAGNSASVERQVTVNGPEAPKAATPSTESGSSGSSSGASTSSGATPTSTTPGVTAPVPNPVAAAAVVSHSLRTALRKGLVVRYSVNEQVAGHFDVLLSRSIAQRLGITGAVATGLPAGTAPQLVIAKAILVTTKGGAAAVDIKFSKRTQARLARLRSVTLMLRLIVRNAATGTPVTTTVLSSVTLSH